MVQLLGGHRTPEDFTVSRAPVCREDASQLKGSFDLHIELTY